MDNMPHPNESVHFPVWIRKKHSMTGRYGRTEITNYLDRIVSSADRQGLEKLFALPAAPGSIRMSG